KVWELSGTLRGARRRSHALSVCENLTTRGKTRRSRRAQPARKFARCPQRCPAPPHPLADPGEGGAPRRGGSRPPPGPPRHARLPRDLRPSHVMTETRALGPTGLNVSPLCLGAMNFGDPTEEPESRAIIDAALDGGITMIDTADVYAGGRSEEIVG